MNSLEKCKEWFDAVELGDADIQLPTEKDGQRYLDYVSRWNTAWAAWQEAEKTSRDAIAGKLIDVWAESKNKQISWKNAIEICHITKAMSDEQKAHLLSLNDEEMKS